MKKFIDRRYEEIVEGKEKKKKEKKEKKRDKESKEKGEKKKEKESEGEGGGEGGEREREKQLIAKIHEDLIDYCVKTTQSSRDFMETRPREDLPPDYKKYPGW